jgi:hypothetical protein
MESIITFASQNGRILVAAAGNNGLPTTDYPAAYPAVIAVSATDTNDDLAYFSNYGYGVSVAAPGVNIISTLSEFDSSANGNNYGNMSGTSMATPYVSGVVGLLLANYPDLSSEKVTQIIKQGVDNPLNSNKYIGAGRINIQKVLTANNELTAKISNPLNGNQLLDDAIISINGTAMGPNFSRYEVLVGNGLYPTSTNLLYSSSTPILNGKLYDLMPSRDLQDGYSTIFLKVYSADNTYSLDKIVLSIDLIDITSPLNNDIYKSGTILDIKGRLSTQNIKSFKIEYREKNSTTWSSNGISIPSSGYLPAMWDTSLIPNKNAYYQLRFTLDTGTRILTEYLNDIYFDPTLKTGYPIKLQNDVDIYGYSQNSLNNLTTLNSFTQVFEKNQISNTNLTNSTILTGRMNIVPSDINNDEKTELIYIQNGQEVKLNVRDVTGNLVWSKAISSSPITINNITEPVIGDINNDSFNEIITCYYSRSIPCSKIQAFDHNGQVLWMTAYNGDYHAKFTLADINNDGKQEIIVKGNMSAIGSIPEMTIMNDRGEIFKNFPLWERHAAGSEEASVAVGNFDNDADLEIVVAAPYMNSEGRVAIYNYDGTLLNGWPKNTTASIFSPPVVADLDNDSKEEIVVGTLDGLYIFKSDGNIMPNFPIHSIGYDNFNNRVWTAPAIGNFDSDFALEVGFSILNNIYLINYDGTNLNGWPIQTPYDESNALTTYDINNDKKPEIITMAGDIRVAGGIYAWNLSGNLEPGFPKIIDTLMYETNIGIGDFDNNGKLELAATSDYDQDITNQLSKMRGSLYMWELNTSDNLLSGLWPFKHHDVGSTGNYNLINRIFNPGDANNDSYIDGRDYMIWMNNYSHSLTGSSNGDFNIDSKIDGIDEVIWFNKYNN